MQAKVRDCQGELYSFQPDFLYNETHPLFRLSQVIDWSQFDEAFGSLYAEGQGRPAKPVRLLVGLEKLLESTIVAGLKTKVLKRTSLQRLNVDTTVQEYPFGA